MSQGRREPCRGSGKSSVKGVSTGRSWQDVEAEVRVVDRRKSQ